MSAKQQLPCSLVIERALTVAGIERRAILSCGTDQHHIYCPAYYQNLIDDAEAALAECEREKERISLQYGANLPATCDWGDCDEKATGFRYDDAGHGWLPICDKHNPLVADLERKLATAREALQAIAEGRGRFSNDNYQFAINTIEDMKAIATAALTEAGERPIASCCGCSCGRCGHQGGKDDHDQACIDRLMTEAGEGEGEK